MGEVFGDDVVAAAMIDRLVHHAEVRLAHPLGLKGDSYRLKDATWAASPPRQPKSNQPEEGQDSVAAEGQDSVAVDRQ